MDFHQKYVNLRRHTIPFFAAAPSAPHNLCFFAAAPAAPQNPDFFRLIHMDGRRGVSYHPGPSNAGH
jgi:hypothetical protein